MPRLAVAPGRDLLLGISLPLLTLPTRLCLSASEITAFVFLSSALCEDRRAPRTLRVDVLVGSAVPLG